VNITKKISAHYLLFLFQISLEKFKPAENGQKSDDEMYEDEVVERPHEIDVEEVILDVIYLHLSNT
jgi:hypothetical protein